MIERGNTISNNILFDLECRKSTLSDKDKNEILFDECLDYNLCPNCGYNLSSYDKPMLVVYGVTEIIHYVYSCSNCSFSYEK